jgi:CopG family transcriptional regulator / antitoxin EndoAI
MGKRINIILPDETIKVLDKVAPKGDRSRLISKAVLYYVKSRGEAYVREQLKAGYLANAEDNSKMAVEWFPLEEELWTKQSGRKKKK